MDQAGDVATNVIGGLQTAGEFAVENPKTAAAITELSLAALPQGIANKVPVLNQASQLAKLPFKAIPAGLEAVNAYSGSKNAEALGKLEHQIRQYTKAGQVVPQQLQEAVDALRGRVAGPVVPPPSMANKVQAAAAQRITNLPNPGMMASAGRMAGKLLPGVGTALNAADAYGRYQEGDYLGAGIAGVGAAASPFPVVGTAVGAVAGGVNAYRDYLKRQEEEKKRMMK